MRNHMHLLAAGVAMIALAANTDTGSAAPAEEAGTAPVGDVTKVTDGQIALTAHNNGDGTWSVTLGPGGVILEDGLPREKALAIVGAPTGPYEPQTDQEAQAAEWRAAVEQRARDYANAEAAKSDKDLGLVDAAGKTVRAKQPEQPSVAPSAGARKGAANTENAKAKNGGE